LLTGESTVKIEICIASLSTVNIRNLDRPVFEWSFFGHFLSPVFKCFGRHFAFKNRTNLPVFECFRLDWTVLYIYIYIKSIYILWNTIQQDHSKTGSFNNRTQIDHSKTGLVRISDLDCTYLSFFQINSHSIIRLRPVLYILCTWKYLYIQ
jgi:hypothetical protein